jgi:hypothetical protein
MTDRWVTKQFRRIRIESGEMSVLYFFGRLNLIIVLMVYAVNLSEGYFEGWHRWLLGINLVPLMLVTFWTLETVKYLWRRKKRKEDGKPLVAAWDERDTLIFYKALACGFAVAWFFLVLGIGWYAMYFCLSRPELLTANAISFIIRLDVSVLVLFFSLSVVLQKHGEEKLDG